MIALNSIIDKIIKIDDISLNNINIFYLQCLGYTSDVKIYKDCIIDNEYVFEEEGVIIEQLYFKAKRIKNKFVKLVRIKKWNKSIDYGVDTDLYLNELKSFKNKHKITILENNTRYKFRLSDIVNYWVESLTSSQGLFSRPIIIKNPYTNLELSIHNLYNIYFKLLDTGFTIPVIITLFFLSNMNIDTFAYKYYHLLKENSIKNFINSNYFYEQWEQVINMLHDFRKDIDYITFTNDLSHRTKITAWKILKKPTYQYLKFKYSCNPLISRDSKDKCKQMLIKCLEDNPDFGFERGIQIMRYVPYTERRRRRPRTNPPPPPPILINSLQPDTSGNLELNIPPPPPVLTTPNIEPPPIPEVVNPFLPQREIARTPQRSASDSVRHTVTSQLSLFRR